MAPDDVEAILTSYKSAKDSDGDGAGVAVRLVNHSEIKANDWDLNISRYIKTAVAEGISVEEALEQLAEAQAGLREAEERLAKRLRAAGYA
jgi:type I restriction enzyme M protein